MHDAYFSITHEHQTYLDGLPEAPDGASPDAAAAAAWVALRALHPSQAATFREDEFVHDATGGRAHGIAIAAAILNARRDDPDASGTYGTEVYTPPGSEVRTPDETLVGLFWGYDGARLGTPPVLYNQILRAVVDRHGNSAAQDARLFALVNVAMADAVILAL